MKVLIVTAYGGWGSTGKIADSIAANVVQHGHDAVLAYGFYRSGYENSVKLKSGARVMSFYEIFKSRLTGYMGFTSRHATKKLIRLIKREKPDVINLHNVHGGYVHIELLFHFIKEACIPVVWTIHDCWSFTGHCAHFEKLGCERWKTGCFDCPDRKLKQSYPISYFFDRSVQQYRRKKNAFTGVENLTVATPSKWLADLAAQSYIGYARIVPVHNGIDINLFQPVESDVKRRYGCENKKLVLAVALGWGERKGYQYVLKLAQRLPKDKYQVMIVGLNERKMQEVPDGIIGLSRTSNQQELAELYSAADVLVNPTLGDTYPTVNLEAIACGTPVVTFRTGGSPESITDRTGAVVEPHDMEALEREVIRWADIDAGQACRDYAVAHFDRKMCFDKYTELFVEAAGRKGTNHQR